VIEIVGALHEGFYSLPKVYGSKVRQTGKVKDFSSGIQEGAKVTPAYSDLDEVS
jgi:sterol 3beta-glucosyltransferase